MPVILLSIAMFIISIIFKLAAVFRLTIPLLYVVAMNTFWRSWYQAHQSLGDIIFFVLLGLDHFSGSEDTKHLPEAPGRKRPGEYCSLPYP